MFMYPMRSEKFFWKFSGRVKIEKLKNFGASGRTRNYCGEYW